MLLGQGFNGKGYTMLDYKQLVALLTPAAKNRNARAKSLESKVNGAT